jgi:hypothetical protein
VLRFGIVLDLQIGTCSDFFKHREISWSAHDPVIFVGCGNIFHEGRKAHTASNEELEYLLQLLKLAVVDDPGYRFSEFRF